MSLPIGAAQSSNAPSAAINNETIQAKIYLPDANHGFYRSTRFDWSGVIASLRVHGHDFYGPWFTKIDPPVHDFIYQGSEIIAGACSAITGPVDEFKPIGFDEAKSGGVFLKIGVGVLRKPDDKPYDNYRVYEIANGGRWQVEPKPDAIEFTQTLDDAASGFGYVYRKTVQLIPGKPEMLLRHSLKNTGKHALVSNVYNHNFLTLDGKQLQAGITVTLPFDIESPRPPDKQLAEIRGRQISYLKPLKDRETVATPIHGFSRTSAADSHIRIENPAAGAGMTIESDRPLDSLSLWSIRSVLAVEPYTAISVQPGADFTWTGSYRYFALPDSR